MVVLKNITNEEYKNELNRMIMDHYAEIYGEEWIDSYLRYLEAKKQSKFRDFIIRDLKRYSTKEDKVNKDMKLIFYNKEKNGDNIAFGLFNEEKLIGYMILTIHTHFTSKWEIDKYGELYRLYIKPEYRAEFLNGNRRNEFVSSVEKYLVDYFRSHNIEDILASIPLEFKELVSLGEDMGFVRASLVDGYIDEKNKDLWKKRI